MGDSSPTAEIRIDTENVEAREVGGELVILDLKSRNYIGGNRSTALLWPLLTAGTTLEEMADQLVSEYAIAPDQAAQDARTLVETLKELGLLRRY